MDTRDYAAALGNALKSMVLLDSLLARSPDSNLMRMRIRAGLAAGDIELRMDRAGRRAGSLSSRPAKPPRKLCRAAPGKSSARTDLARSQTGAAAANERLRHWREAVNAYRSAGQTWSALRGLQALAPEDAGQPEKAEAAMARCQRRI